jgi:uncharacterized repeat protein (TIGR03803 family)
MANLKTLVGFDETDGARPEASLAIDAAGNLFGTTPDGGASSAGTVFEVARVGAGYASTPTVLVSLTGVIDEGPIGGVLIDAAGNLVGTGEFGGANGDGDVFEVQKTPPGFASSAVTLADFNETNGLSPTAGLTTDAAGNLFGTTSGGGTKHEGTVFEIPKTASGYGTLTTLVSFGASVSDGRMPKAGLITDAAGDLFGTTSMGGLGSDGTVFEIAKNGVSYASSPITLAAFDGSKGAFPSSGLVADAAGDLFGTTNSGPSGSAGTVFEIPKSASGYGALITLVTFDITDGATPNGDLIIDAAGNLFGTTETGGASLSGTAFEIPKVSGSYASTPVTLVNFKLGTDGSRPFGGLVADAQGNLFGATTDGGVGTGQAGTVFEITGSGFATATPCFAAGTWIRTPRGDVRVEDLHVGDNVVLAIGQTSTVVWIGQLLVDCRRHPQPTDIQPVRVVAHAFGLGCPVRDLLLSPDHAVFVEGKLVPIRYLLNGATVQQQDVAAVTYWHVELPTHAVLLAEGLPCESYLDTGNRAAFGEGDAAAVVAARFS